MGQAGVALFQQVFVSQMREWGFQRRGSRAFPSGDDLVRYPPLQQDVFECIRSTFVWGAELCYQ